MISVINELKPSFLNTVTKYLQRVVAGSALQQIPAIRASLNRMVLLEFTVLTTQTTQQLFGTHESDLFLLFPSTKLI